jgi:hypothetical protein
MKQFFTYYVCENLCDSIYNGSGTVNNYGSGSDFLTSYRSGSVRQKVTVPTVPVPQHCLILKEKYAHGYSTSFGCQCKLCNGYLNNV